MDEIEPPFLQMNCDINDVRLLYKAVEFYLDNYPESAHPLRPATPAILRILSQLKLIDLEPSSQLQHNLPESPTSIKEINIQPN